MHVCAHAAKRHARGIINWHDKKVRLVVNRIFSRRAGSKN